jgi:hypothetical protein
VRPMMLFSVVEPERVSRYLGPSRHRFASHG